MTDQADSQPQSSAPVQRPRRPQEMSGRLVVGGIFAFSVLAVAVLWIYSVLHAAPFLELTRAIGTHFPDSRPKVTGGQHKVRPDSPKILRVVVRGNFGPESDSEADERKAMRPEDLDSQLESRAAKFAEDVRDFVIERYPQLPDYNQLEIHVFWPEPEQEIHQWPYSWEVEDLLQSSAPPAAGNQPPAAETDGP